MSTDKKTGEKKQNETDYNSPLLSSSINEKQINKIYIYIKKPRPKRDLNPSP